MPQYDYRCRECRDIFTIERSMDDDTEPSCSSCGSSKAIRIWNVSILAGGSTQDVGQGTHTGGSSKKSGCGSCSSKSCGSCCH